MACNERATTEESVGEVEAAKSCLSEDIIMRVAKVSKKLEILFDFTPRDVEFAVKGGQIYLLQARPITSLDVWTDEELRIESDRATCSSHDMYSRANLGEVLAGSLSPLTQSVVGKMLDINVQDQIVSKCKADFNPYMNSYVGFIATHAIMNYLDSTLSVITSPTLDLGKKALDMSISGHLVTTQEDLNVALERRGVSSKTGVLKEMLSATMIVLRNIYHQKYGYNSGESFCSNASSYASSSSKDILALIMNKIDTIIRLNSIHSTNSQASTIFQFITFMIMAEGGSDFSPDLCRDAAELLASTEDVEVLSAGVPNGLEGLCDAICNANAAEAEQFCAENDLTKATAWIRAHRDVSSLYDKFLKTFQYRCLREFEFTSVPWGQDPEPLIRTLQALVKAKLSQTGGKVQSAVKKLSLDERLEKMTSLTAKTKNILKKVLPYVIGSMALREESKGMNIEFIGEMRQIFQCLGKALQREGKLPEPSLIFFLTLFELKEIVASHSTVLVQKAKRRMKLRDSLEQLQFNEINHGVPKPLAQDRFSKADFDCQGGIKIKGTPVCRGKVQGVARVMTKLEDASLIQAGDILITHSTDIGWSPYFPLLSGVVTEIGGLISHGAVVAREYGLPCVVGATGATQAFESGDSIFLDSIDGFIMKTNN